MKLGDLVTEVCFPSYHPGHDLTFARKFHRSPCGGKRWMSLEGHRDGMVDEHVGVLNTPES